MRGKSQPGFGRLAGVAAAAVVACIPLVAYLWETVNRLLAGRVEPARLAVSVPALLLFVGCLAVLGSAIQRLDSTFRD